MRYLCTVVVFLLNLPVVVFAHGVDISDMTGRQDVRTIRFFYTDGMPMLFARVKVFPPSSPDVPVQESIADRNGYFSFVSDESGEWRLTAEDGMGHRGEIIVDVDGETEAVAGAREAVSGAHLSSGTLPTSFAAVLGLSLIFNVFGLWYITKKRILRREAVHAH
ncbi:MAG: hypothetical protein LBJ41_09335 [Treponema sp.]|jgi:hypothetical protein|nr:hypothetical protein [Treponema sp.]